MSASSDRLGLFSKLICGRCRMYGIKRDMNIITLNYFYFVWSCDGNVKALCFKAIILRPNPVLAVF